ncbi:TRAP transporter large permease subunit [Tabrizicola piscis]|uniref:TRAP transporter large permease subunit n=1 Tax=Tabrizicola piscis TaxID=2494374 RepID=A0A3S8U1R0_9RHOB|nr:TRAP transporter large permease subunit [Tabrizicola piscis]AZL57550.1 TRAP transporter large permease subunit [Tabrizicola piscis]
MIEVLAHNMAPIIFASLVIFLLIGYPVAFSLAANGLIFFVIGVWLAPYSNGEITLDWPLLGTMPQRLWGILSNETLLAIPFFTFMGIILERSGMAEDLLDTIGQLFGPIRGGLAFAVILVGALLAATTGVVAASVIAMGLISLPIMLRYGYDRQTATGVIAASGTLAQIIPPSLVLIILADQLGRSVGDMYRGAMIPGLILTGMYMGYICMIAIFQPHRVPALPPEARTLGGGVTSLLLALAVGVGIGYATHIWAYEDWGNNADVLGATIGVLVVYFYALADRYLGINLLSRLAQQVIMVLIPPLALIFLVLGTIFIGLATPTEGGAMGALGAMILAWAKGRFKFPVLQSALLAATRLSAFVMFVLIGARMFSLTFYGVNGHVWVEELLTGVPGGQLGFLLVINVIIFILGFFLDFFEIAFVLIPLLIAPAQTLGIDLIWLGVIIGVNLQTSFLTPPFGFALFYLRSVAAKVPYLDKVTGKKMDGIKTGEIYKGAIPFIIIQVSMIFIVVFFPQIVMHYKGPVVDPSTIEITVPGFAPLAPPGGTGVGSTLGAPTLGVPNFGAPAEGGGAVAPAPAPGGLPALPGAPQLGAPVINP